MRVGILLFSLAGLGVAGQAAAASRFIALSAPRGFVEAHVVHARSLGHERGRYFNGAIGLDTLQTGTFESAPDDETGLQALPPPYPPPGYYYPAYYTRPRPCIRPLLIHLVAEKPPANLPRIVYGTNPPDCPE